MPALSVFVLAVLAGAFIALGAVFATTVMAGGSELPFGVTRLLGGLAFSLGLILVVVAGAELFTGNNLVVMAWASRRVSTRRLLGNWALVYAGNFVGALGTVADRLPRPPVRARRWRGRRDGRPDRRGEDEPRLRPGRRARGALQRARLPRRLAHLQRAHRDRQDPRGRAADRRLRRRRVRAQRREHVLHPDRPARAGPRGRSGHRGRAPELERVLPRQPPPGDDRERDRRRRHGRRRLLARLSPRYATAVSSWPLGASLIAQRHAVGRLASCFACSSICSSRV